MKKNFYNILRYKYLSENSGRIRSFKSFLSKVLLCSSLFTFLVLFCSGQKEGNIWYFGFKTGLDFNSGSPMVLTNGQINVREGCASICDKQTGQILFYSEGQSVWNRNHVVMPNGDSLKGNWSATQSSLIVPMPGSSTKYYLFTVGAHVGYYGGASGVNYSIVDMTLDNGSGDVEVAGKNTKLIDSTSEKLCAVRYCNGRDVWIVIHKWNSNSFYAYLITPSGISAPVISNTGSIHKNYGSSNNAESIGCMKFSPDGKKLAVACYFYGSKMEIFDFDNTTGVISNASIDTNFPVTTNGPYGVSFSPDNTRLYLSSAGNIFQYNMQAGSGAAIIASRLQVMSSPTYWYGTLQNGPDGRMYVAKIYSNLTGSPTMDVISNPNALGTLCGYSANAINMGGGTHLCGMGLSNMVEDFLSSPKTAVLTYSSGCAIEQLIVTDSLMNGSVSFSWNFGDPASGTADTSTLQNPSHTFSSSGTYIVKLYLSNECAKDTITKIVAVTDSGNINVSPRDTLICSGDFVQLHASGGTTYKWSPALGLSDPDIADPIAYPSITTTYTVIASPASCGDSTATIKISVYSVPPTPFITQSHDTLFCSIDPSYTSYQWYDDTTLIEGATNSFLIISHGGNYNVQVANENGCKIAVGINIILGVGQQIHGQECGFPLVIGPNPSAGDINLLLESAAAGSAEAVVYDAIGKVVFKKKFMLAGGKQILPLQLSDFVQGIYLLELTLTNSHETIYKTAYHKIQIIK